VTFDVQAALEALRRGEEAARRRTVAELALSRRPEAIPALLLAVGDESWGVRQGAIESLAGFPTGALLSALELALRDGDDAGLRNAAMEIYVRLGPTSAGPLLALLGDADEEVRLFAAVMLGSLKEARAVADLVRALSDPNGNVRHAAAASLGQIGSPEAVPRLIEALRSEPWLQYPAIHALGEIADHRAAPALLDLLDDDFLRAPALEALGRLAGRDALPRIAPRLLDPDPVLRNAAIRAVVEIEQRATASGESLDPGVQEALRRGDLVAHLIGMLADEDARNRRTGAITLGWLREGRASRPLLALLGDPAVREFASHALVSIGYEDRAAWEEALAHPDDAVRLGSVRCLAWIAPAEGTALVAPLIHDPAEEVRAEAAAAIGRLGDEDAPMLLFELLGDESELIQESAMEALSRMSPERVRPLLLQALAGGEVQAQVRAAQTLGLLRDGAATTALVAAARHPREAVRAAALQALGEMPGPGGLAEMPAARAPGEPPGPNLLGVLRQALADDSSLVRQQAVLALGRLREPEAAADLLPLLDVGDPRLRFAAVRALGQVRNREAAEHLLPLLQESRQELRFAAVEALGQIRAPAAVRPLVEVLRDPDRNLRRAAAEGLGEIGDPQAVPSLLVALQDEHWSVRCAAAAALGRLASPKAVAALIARTDDDDATVRRAAVSALGEIGDPRSAACLAAALADPALQAAGREALRRLGRAALPAMERAFASGALEPDARRLLVDVAGRLEDPAARRLLLAGLSDPSASVRVEAAHALGDGGFREALRPLLELKSTDPASEVRQAASGALRKLQPR
jgi:HEAT repeat protein